jgi:hypothetical protein
MSKKLCMGDIAQLQKTQADEQVFPYEGTWYSRKNPNYGFRFTKTSSGIKVTYMNGSSILVNDFGFLQPSEMDISCIEIILHLFGSSHLLQLPLTVHMYLSNKMRR